MILPALEEHLVCEDGFDPFGGQKPRQSVGEGCQKSFFSWSLWLSKVETVFKGGFEAIYHFQRSSVEP